MVRTIARYQELLLTPSSGDPVMDTMLFWTERTRYPLDINCVGRTYDEDRCVSYQRVFNVSACKIKPFLDQNKIRGS